ncbi:MAG: hypothetical protein H8D78_07550 [Chloroflexi bacterium]|nr:hypothetical protein [Chloroflexota bacterium]
MTMRMPEALHQAVSEEAMREEQSLNRTVIDLLWQGLTLKREKATLSEHERFLAAVRRAGLGPVEIGPWADKYIEAASDVTIEEVREMWKGQRPLSEDIIADRGER